MRNLIIIFSLFSTHILASVCANINLYEDSNLTRKIHNQGDMHTCYAHSLSALYHHEFQEEVNPYWIAYIHKDRLLHWSPRNLNFSLLSWAFSDLKKKGKCSATLLASKLAELKQGSGYSDDQFFYFVQIYFKKEKDPRTLYEYLLKNSKDFKIKWSQEDVNNLVTSIKTSNQESLFDFFENEVFQDCDQISLIQGNLKSTGRAFESNSRLQEIIVKQLTQKKALSIGLCPDAAYKFKSKDITIKPRLLKATKSGCGAHYVNIVGARENKNQCELLIRNSYPGFWAHKSLQCLCSKNGTTYNCNSQTKDKVLGCWIPSEKVLTNTYDISYFE